MDKSCDQRRHFGSRLIQNVSTLFRIGRFGTYQSECLGITILWNHTGSSVPFMSTEGTDGEMDEVHVRCIKKVITLHPGC